MNGDKARELFSEYRERTLSATLKASLEQALRSDSSLASDYREFDNLLASLEASHHETYEIPFDLHDKIMARVDKSVFETKRNAKTSWFSGWRLALTSGLAVLVVAGTVISLNSPSSGPSMAGVGIVNSTKGMELVGKDGSVNLTHGASNTVIVVKDDTTGDLVKRFDLAGKSLNSPLSNDRDTAVVLSIQSDTESNLLVLPGKVRSTVLAGKGTIKDLAKALSDATGQPVRIEVKDTSVTAGWMIDAEDPSRTQVTDGAFSVDKRNGLLYLTD